MYVVSWVTQLFARSPFEPLRQQQLKVQECASLVPDLVDAALDGDQAQVKALAKKISVLEYEADIIKTRVRDHLPKSLFMPVSRSDLLDVVSAMDAVADIAEDLGVLFSMRAMEPPPDEVATLIRQLVESCVAVVLRATEVVSHLDSLASTSFTGPEAEQVLVLIDHVDREEHEADKVQDQLAKAFFRHEDDFKPAAIYVWMKIFNKIGDLANASEKMTHRIRLFLAK